jgi:hypothetical protein
VTFSTKSDVAFSRLLQQRDYTERKAAQRMRSGNQSGGGLPLAVILREQATASFDYAISYVLCRGKIWIQNKVIESTGMCSNAKRVKKSGEVSS